MWPGKLSAFCKMYGISLRTENNYIQYWFQYRVGAGLR
jgi:hypothetical protein